MTPLTLFPEPRARATDPDTSRFAAAALKPASAELIKAVRWYVSKQHDPVSAFQIAEALCGRRWSEATVRTAVSRAGLHAVDACGTTPRNRRCLRYVLRSAS